MVAGLIYLWQPGWGSAGVLSSTASQIDPSQVQHRHPDPAGHAWHVILGANGDEMRDRPWRAGRHWLHRPSGVTGLYELAGGSSLGINAEASSPAALNPGQHARSRLGF